ncbi:glutamate-5-semialdehyde dehydrogenase [Legionella pneumophila]|uniref:Gamma-glutamyl phosphate reductase n=1 Tax=Legionella pneumophila subsp. pascullei TaxID=91890 RepID=A0AAX2IWZ8_LEGPN|nr:glutamate-5-semialdehyde dehydrogenase [Legionella pneumophila]AMP89743.1 gamma-glutamyl-phosphate reductase [Legionella pneumophila subsp. pascullei]AMP92591.1 gamma-glutamyl-phosphate reductase [Legionella pneumophila subsp. pascullei]AMP95556.1 gamma-glutamyl-phosphate reductase [Legionella pneumophila subsp. pascullei]SQG90466.1 proA gamma-glutamyl phosphate reductase [Legionella pneumophila subsp. pascullei]VEH06764.1 proA gamma-glutamyl phosphate reductase [Legionella pneumophila subs
MNTHIINQLRAAKKATTNLNLIQSDTRAKVLKTLAANLEKHLENIIQENQKDLSLMLEQDPKYDRLLLSKDRILSLANDVRKVADLPNPLGVSLLEKSMPSGLIIKKITVPLGVIAVIYESRPNVTIDIFSLCFKSGNVSILKGGKEAYFTNSYLVLLIKNTLKNFNIDTDLVCLLPPERALMTQLLNATGFVDLCIPRGSQNLINFVRDNAKIPVIETGAGIVHVYFDKSGDLEKGKKIINNAKTRRVSVCNALDTLIIHTDRLKHLPELVEALSKNNVIIYADKAAYQALDKSYPEQLLMRANPQDFGHEFLDYKLAIKTVPNIQAAIDHIQQFSSHHSEAIIAEEESAIDKFLIEVDAAAVYANASTAFTDGGEFGLGAEIGISTQKVHARGPMGLDALTSYKWVIRGTGQIRN